jgi:hypothetical protein
MKKKHTQEKIMSALVHALHLMIEQEMEFFNITRDEITENDGPIYEAKKAMIMANAWPDRKAK